MKHFQNILLAYRTAEESMPTPVGSDGADAETGILSSIHSCAYYLILFAQFEAVISARAEHIIEEGLQAPVAQQRRAWQVIHDRNRKRILDMRFLDRLALIVDRGSHLYRDVEELYKQRSMIAHGGMLGEWLDILAIATRLNAVVDRITSEHP